MSCKKVEKVREVDIINGTQLCSAYSTLCGFTLLQRVCRKFEDN